MANPTNFPGDIVVAGSARISGSITPKKAKSDVLAIASSQTYTIPMSIWRKHDAYATPLTGSPAADDLGLIGGTFGTNAPSLQTNDFGGNAEAVAYYARGEIQLPAEYVAGQVVKIRVHAGMLETVADQSATVDIEAYKSDEDETSTGDLCTTDAVSDNMNSLVFSDIDFTITPTTLSPGDLLDVRITVTVDDDGDGGTMKACIGSVQLLCDVR
jgi:hypothetical protein